MKAIVQHGYGGPEVLSLQDIEKPAPADDEVLIRVRASSVNMADVDYLRGRPVAARLAYGLRKPKYLVPGTDVAGEVEAVGPRVTRFQPGDEVWGDLTESGSGAYAEYVCANEATLAPKPPSLDFEEAASVPSSGVLAAQAVRAKGHIRRGDQVLINGASGNVGPFAVQIARSFGAEVTGVCSAAKMELVRSIGAAHVIDYRSQDYTRAPERYDRIVDIAARRSILASRRALRPGGAYVWAGGSMAVFGQAMILGPLLWPFGRRRIGIVTWKPFHADDVTFLRDLIESGKLHPVIGRRFRLSEVPDALRYQESGQAQGKIVITV